MKKMIFALSVLLCLHNSYAMYGQQDTFSSIKKIVIDPGHGGYDPGALSPDRKLLEKNINLSVATYLGQEIKANYPSIEVIYTRNSDKAVDLDKRGAIATQAHADLFISIHVNSSRKSTSAALGPETWVFGGDRSQRNDESYDVVLQENEVIKFEENYKTKYEGFDPDNPQSMIVFNFQKDAIMRQCKILGTCVQKSLRNGPLKGSQKDRGMKEGGLMVLAYCSMPAILVELGFINSASDRKILSTDSGRKKLAHQLFLGFKAYRDDAQAHNGVLNQAEMQSANTPAPTTATPNQIKTSTAANTSSRHFRVQIVSSITALPDNAPEFKKHSDVERLEKAGERYRYKYTLGHFSTKEEAQSYCNTLRKKDFPGAFVIIVENDSIITK